MFWKKVVDASNVATRHVKGDEDEEPVMRSSYETISLNNDLRSTLKFESESFKKQIDVLKDTFLNSSDDRVHNACKELEIMNSRVLMKMRDIQEMISRCELAFNDNVCFVDRMSSICFQIKESVGILNLEIDRYIELKHELYNLTCSGSSLVYNNTSDSGTIGTEKSFQSSRRDGRGGEVVMSKTRLEKTEEEDDEDLDDVEKRFMKECRDFEMQNNHHDKEENGKKRHEEEDDDEEDNMHTILESLITNISKLKHPMNHDTLDSLQVQMPCIPDFEYPCQVRYPHALDRQNEFLRCISHMFNGVNRVCQEDVKREPRDVYRDVQCLSQIMLLARGGEQQVLPSHMNFLLQSSSSP